PVGEVDDAQDAVDHRHPDGRDRDHRARDEAVREELEEHQTIAGSGTSRPSPKRAASSTASAGSGGSPTTAPATMRATAGASMNPWPLKPAATWSPSSPGS